MAANPDPWPSNTFADLEFDLARCLAELTEFETLLATQPELRERSDILPFFRQRPQLSALLGTYDRNLARYDRLGYELSLVSDFVADVVVGDRAKQSYCFVEFEHGQSDSIFKKKPGRKATEWAPLFDHGCSQIIDWFWKLDDLKRTTTFERLFGSFTIDLSGLLVIGRDRGVTTEDQPRLHWRRKYVVVNSQQLYCCTYDEFARDLRLRLDYYPSAARVV